MKAVGRSASSAIVPIKWDFIIGGVALDAFEVPSEFTIGFEKQIATHKYLGQTGDPAIATHVLGVYPVPTSWKGTLFTGFALQRYQQLESLATSLTPTVFQYGPLFYDVQVSKLTGTIRSQIEIEYDIELIVIAAHTSNSSIPSFNPTYNNDLDSIYDAGNVTYNSLNTTGRALSLPVPYAVQQAYTDMQNNINANKPLGNATFQGLKQVINKVSVFANQLAVYVEVLQASRLDSKGNTKLLSALSALSYFRLFSANLQQLQNGSASNLTVVAEAGSNLFLIACKFYPRTDVSTAVALLASANNLKDYFITKQTVINIPPVYTTT